jgi:hypothetical protein
LIRPDPDHAEPVSDAAESNVPASAQAPPQPSPLSNRTGAIPVRTAASNGAKRTQRRREVRWFWPITCALCAAVIVLVAGEFEYTAQARLKVATPADACRRELLDFLWNLEQIGRVRNGWSVSATEDDTLELKIIANDPTLAAESARTVSREFEEHIRNRSVDLAGGRREVNGLLEQLVQELQDDSKTQRDTVANLQTETPDHDALSTREQLRRDLAIHTQSLEVLRSAEKETIAEIDAITAKPLPAFGHVKNEDRQAAYAARQDLVQDLRQLDVQLQVARRTLDDVWQNASRHLDDLMGSASRLARSGLGTNARGAPGSLRATLSEVRKRAGLYQTRLSTFARHWTQAFTQMRAREIDPLAADDLFASQNRLHELLGDFSHHSARLVDDLRSDVNALSVGQGNIAPFQKTISETKRAFHRLEANHRQFEFVASDVFRRNNFRLDSALKSATGLDRRVRLITAQIDAEIEAIALERAKTIRAAQRVEILDELARQRTGINQTMDAIIALQADLEREIPQADVQLRSVAMTDAANRNLARIEHSLTEREAQLDSLKKRDAKEGQAYFAELISATAGEMPTNLLSRVLFALVAAAVTFLTVSALTHRWRPVPWEPTGIRP